MLCYVYVLYCTLSLSLRAREKIKLSVKSGESTQIDGDSAKNNYTLKPLLPPVSVELIFSLLAVVLASAGVLFYVKDRKEIKNSMKGIRDDTEKISSSFEDLSQKASDAIDAFPLNSPDFFGKVIAKAATEFFSGTFTEQEDGTIVELPPDEAAFQFVQGQVVTATNIVTPMALQELPILLAASHSKKVASALGKKSAVARGVNMLPDGLGGLQSLQKGMALLPGDMGSKAIGWIQNIEAGIQVYNELKESGIVDMIQGGNGESTPSLPPAGGGGGMVDF